jgi:hypothetical protein
MKYIKNISENFSNIDNKLYTKEEVISLIQDFYIDSSKYDYNNDVDTNFTDPRKPGYVDKNRMKAKVVDWMKGK